VHPEIQPFSPLIVALNLFELLLLMGTPKLAPLIFCGVKESVNKATL
jgi:hypothetical protein